MGGKHAPPSSCRGTNGRLSDKATRANKAAIWPTFQVLGEQALAEGDCKAQGHRHDCAGPSLGWTSLSCHHAVCGSQAGLTPPVLQRL